MVNAGEVSQIETGLFCLSYDLENQEVRFNDLSRRGCVVVQLDLCEMELHK